ncbi:MAG: hypothetical protein WCE54_13505 [Ignavibacteriaceae bacterium]
MYRNKREKYEKISIFFVLISASLLIVSCAQSRIERVTLAIDNADKFHQSEEFPFIKLHMQNGEVYILNSWENEEQNKLIRGIGKHLDFNRTVIDSGNFSIHYNDISLIETNKIGGNNPLLVLSIMSGVSILTTAFCIINPKACFGSCPTFYISDGNQYKLQAEGFSASVSPSLEDSDIDALYNIKPACNVLDLQVRNEALETHVIRHVNILALPKTKKVRVLAAPDGKFFEASNIQGIKYAEDVEGDCTKKLLAFDGNERFSFTDSSDLAEKETIELEFDTITNNSPKGLIIACRQTLLSTFLFYQSLAYMGEKAGFYFSQLERKGSILKEFIKYPGEILKNIEVRQQDSSGNWIKINQTGESGPIAADIKIVPLNNISATGKLKLQLRMTKGMWRIDYTALADLGKKAAPILIKPSNVLPSKRYSSNVLNLLTNEDSLLVTLPGEKYNIYYELPDNYKDYEYFIESRGYYLEWIRDAWLTEENPEMVNEMIFNTNQYFKDLAPEYKKIEAGMEEAFWRSKYVNP